MATIAPDATDVPLLKRGGAKKLIVTVLGGLLLLGAGAGVAAYFLKQHQAKLIAEIQAAEEDDHASAKPKRDPNVVPVFVPLEPFTVNLADRNADRYAQMTVSLEVEGGKTSERARAFMPVIRNNMLFVLSRKSAADISHIDGKQQLARELHIAAMQAIGADTTVLEPPPPASSPAARKKRREAPPPPPILGVHFSTLIIQ